MEVEVSALEGLNYHPGFNRLEKVLRYLPTDADRHKFVCLDCKLDLTSIVYSLPYDGRYHRFACPRCGREKGMDVVKSTMWMMRKTRRVSWEPSVDTGIYVPQQVKKLKRKPKPKIEIASKYAKVTT